MSNDDIKTKYLELIVKIKEIEAKARLDLSNVSYDRDMNILLGRMQACHELLEFINLNRSEK